LQTIFFIYHFVDESFTPSTKDSTETVSLTRWNFQIDHTKTWVNAKKVLEGYKLKLRPFEDFTPKRINKFISSEIL
jgi:hypothetical protein